MKFSTATMEVLNNAAAINPSIILREGNCIRVGTDTLSIFLQAKIDESFDKQVGIYDLKKFLSVLSLFDDPDVELNEKSITVSSGDQRIEYVLGDQNLIKSSPNKEPNVPAPECTFSVSRESLSKVLKAAAVLNVPHVSLEGDGKSIYLVAKDRKNASKDVYRDRIGDTDKTFECCVFKTSFKMIASDYEVSVHSAYAKFDNGTVTYWLAPVAD